MAADQRRPVVDLTDDEARLRPAAEVGRPRRRHPGLGRGDGLRGRPGGARGGPADAGRRDHRLPALRLGRASWRSPTPPGRHGTSAGRPTPSAVHPVVDVTAGVRLAHRRASAVPGAWSSRRPGYNAQFGLASDHGPRRGATSTCPPRADRAEIDLDRLDRLFADGAQTLLLTQPHNPWGRVFTRAELEGDPRRRRPPRCAGRQRRDPRAAGAARRRARLLPLDRRHRTTTRSRSWPRPRRSTPRACGARRSSCPTAADATACSSTSRCRATTRYSPRRRRRRRGRRTTTATRGSPSLVERLDQQRALLGELLAEHLPEVRMRPLEATYLAWLDASRLRPRRRRGRRARARSGAGQRRGSPTHPAPPATCGSNIATSPGPAHRDRRAARQGLDPRTTAEGAGPPARYLTRAMRSGARPA